jgi:hypothetical protein
LPLDGLPSEVVHSSLVHFFKDFCDLASAITCNRLLLSCTELQATEPYEQTIRQGLHL